MTIIDYISSFCTKFTFHEKRMIFSYYNDVIAVIFVFKFMQNNWNKWIWNSPNEFRTKKSMKKSAIYLMLKACSLNNVHFICHSILYWNSWLSFWHFDPVHKSSSLKLISMLSIIVFVNFIAKVMVFLIWFNGMVVITKLKIYSICS